MTDDQSTQNNPAPPITADILQDATVQAGREILEVKASGVAARIQRNNKNSKDLSKRTTEIVLSAWTTLYGDYPLDPAPLENALRQALANAVDEALQTMNLKLRERELLAAVSLGHLIEIEPGSYMITDQGRDYVRTNIFGEK